jgi:hypothetical protein
MNPAHTHTILILSCYIHLHLPCGVSYRFMAVIVFPVSCVIAVSCLREETFEYVYGHLDHFWEFMRGEYLQSLRSGFSAET